MYTVDASLWVNGFSQMEAGHATGRQVLEGLRTRAPPIIVPNLVLAEVAGAISRTWNDPLRAEPFATTLGWLPNVTVVALDMALDDQARPLAAARLAGGRCGVCGGRPAGGVYLDLARPPCDPPTCPFFRTTARFDAGTL